MPRKKKDVATEETPTADPKPPGDIPVAIPVTEEPPASEPPAEAPEDKAPDNGKNGGPEVSFSVPVQRDTYVRAAVWARVVTLKGGEQFSTHEVSVSKRYKDGAGEWKTGHSFRGSELYALAHVVRRAEEYILNLRTQTKEVPF